MGKLVRKSQDVQPSEQSIEDKKTRLKKIFDRKEKSSKSEDNSMLTSIPLSMSNTMQFINDRNAEAKLSPNYGKITKDRNNFDNLSDHDIFRKLFTR